MELSSLPLAFFAGVLSLLSPCVLPFIPAVAASAMQSSRLGLWFLAAGLCSAFALMGTVITFLLLNAGISPSIMRTVSALLMLLVACALLSRVIGDYFATLLSKLMSRLPNTQVFSDGTGMQFVIGASLGLAWLPCVGPTLGTAIALASQGQQLTMAFFVMLAFGLGAAIPLVYIGYFAGNKLQNMRFAAKKGKQILGVALALLALFILTGVDKILEMWALSILPSWVSSI